MYKFLTRHQLIHCHRNGKSFRFLWLWLILEHVKIKNLLSVRLEGFIRIKPWLGYCLYKVFSIFLFIWFISDFRSTFQFLSQWLSTLSFLCFLFPFLVLQLICLICFQLWYLAQLITLFLWFHWSMIFHNMTWEFMCPFLTLFVLTNLNILIFLNIYIFWYF